MIRTRQAFDEQLRQLEQKLLQLGACVESMLEKAMRALIQQDLNLAREVVADDDIADDLDLEIEQFCMRLLALQQPMSRDLRLIGTVMKVISDIERIGDYAVDIAKCAIRLSDTAYFKPLVDIPLMGERVRQLLRLALTALVRHDLELVRQVIALDDEVDELWAALREELETLMEQRPEVVRQAVSLLLVARYLERIADHTVNIAERVAYMETGKLETLAASHRADVPTNGHRPPEDSAPPSMCCDVPTDD
jgi:phosphate transport system protein